jgi:purine catabolism regulator
VIDTMTVEDALALPTLARAKVVGGHGGLRRPIRSVNVMEVPDILDWVKADELLLTTAYPLRDRPEMLDTLVPDLASRGLAGIALKPARYIARIPQTMVSAADRLDFPLIELPPQASFNEIINSVLTVILNVQASRLQRSAAIHDRFTEIVLSGGGLREIGEALAGLIGRAVTIVDAAGTTRYRSAEDAPPSVDAAAGGHVQRIQVGGEDYGSILIAGSAGDLAPEALEAVAYASTVAALRQVQARAVAEGDRRFQAVCLEELVTGHVTDRGVLMERAAAFSWDLTVPRAVLLVEIEAMGERPFSALAGTAEEAAVRHRLAEAARFTLGPGAIIWERTNEIGALVADAGGSALRDLASAVHADVARRVPGLVASVGVGRPVADPLELRVSYPQARHALSVGRWAHGPGRVTTFDELGLDRLLVALPAAEAASFRDAALGELEAYDAAHGTSLVTTLDAYLTSRNAALAARQLYLHYNTLKNRLARIEDLIGPVLDDPDQCLTLSLALRMRRMLVA